MAARCKAGGMCWCLSLYKHSLHCESKGQWLRHTPQRACATLSTTERSRESGTSGKPQERSDDKEMLHLSVPPPPPPLPSTLLPSPHCSFPSIKLSFGAPPLAAFLPSPPSDKVVSSEHRGSRPQRLDSDCNHLALAFSQHPTTEQRQRHTLQ
ncbi:unnamed protein product [Pleuronectes platessa]|uniref:Uncharacterized protein n=1 Tax=Pleuronectes platessa TaxID=8262 RepID=A0A9N7TXT1_PLEPL|nr:unnamed protein product [Pleuronectes platessa]